jgi:hypothetical protein
MAMGSLVLGVIGARGIGDDAKERGGQSPVRHAGLWIARGVWGVMIMPSFEIFSSSRILSDARTSP